MKNAWLFITVLMWGMLLLFYSFVICLLGVNDFHIFQNITAIPITIMGLLVPITITACLQKMMNEILKER